MSLFNRNAVAQDPPSFPRRRNTAAYAALTLKVTLSKEALNEVYERIVIGIFVSDEGGE